MTDEQLMQRIDAIAKDAFSGDIESMIAYKQSVREELKNSIRSSKDHYDTIVSATDEAIIKMLNKKVNIAQQPPINTQFIPPQKQENPVVEIKEKKKKKPGCIKIGCLGLICFFIFSIMMQNSQITPPSSSNSSTQTTSRAEVERMTLARKLDRTRKEMKAMADALANDDAVAYQYAVQALLSSAKYLKECQLTGEAAQYAKYRDGVANEIPIVCENVTKYMKTKDKRYSDAAVQHILTMSGYVDEYDKVSSQQAWNKVQ